LVVRCVSKNNISILFRLIMLLYQSIRKCEHILRYKGKKMLNTKYKILVVIVRADELKILNWMLSKTLNNAMRKKKRRFRNQNGVSN